MDYYIEFKVLPDLEADASFLLNNLFSKLHAVLGQTTQGKVGVSFPQYGKQGKFVRLGEILRLHGEQAYLIKLMAEPWLIRMRDYCDVSSISPIPANVEYCSFYRAQAKSVHNKRKRSIAKGWLTEEQAVVKIPDGQEQQLTQPYIQMKSRGNGSVMRIHIAKTKPDVESNEGEFGSYGLSNKANQYTVPWF